LVADEDDAGRGAGLLQGLEQGVGRVHIGPLEFGDDENLISALHGREGRFSHHLANLVDEKLLARGSEEPMIGMHALCGQPTGAAAPTRAQTRFVLRAFAGEGLSKGSGQGGLSDVLGTSEEVSMSGGLVVNGASQEILGPSMPVNAHLKIVHS